MNVRVSKNRLRLSRQATAYARLAAKADRAGEFSVADSYRATEARIRARAERA